MKMKKLILVIGFFALQSCETVNQILQNAPVNGGLSTTQIAAGLKEALSIGAQKGAGQLSAVDGFFANAAIKILMPPEAQNVEKTLRSVGLGSVIDDAILSMNRAAEEAAKSAAPIFLDAVKNMSIADAVGILKGGDFAATDYFKQNTSSALTAAFSPVINNAMAKVNVTKYWNDVFSVYNKFSSKPIDTDLGAYVTSKALNGIFYAVGQEEQKIRKDPLARVTELLKSVFGSSLAQGNG
jgi:hypothetical protein